MKTWKPWTVNEERKLLALRTAGVTMQAIADELRRTVDSVKCRLWSMEICLPTVIDRRERWMSLLVGQPVSLKVAAKIMGVSVNAVKGQKRRLRRAGFDVPRMRGQ